ncbi:o-methyltransferase [Aspergillus phoenicis ATCC 13157]|uniref:O-methyltransferase n=1 Tax=Aspergillus phoenicis ATCC 13157 TaxID=1353007 RepID=A0A370PQC1_ASPPH|nr:o-methyltransferase [Aspergillus phoenicis ATCC 13157]
MSLHEDDKRMAEVDRIAVAPKTPDQVPNLIAQINNFGLSFTLRQSGARLKLVDAAESLLAAVETPRETIWRYFLRSSTGWAAIETAIDLGIFRLLAEAGQPKSVQELASATRADLVLIQRIMRHLGAINVVIETENGEYTTNCFSFTLAHTKYSDSFPAAMGSMYPPNLTIPKFLRQNNYQTPTDGRHCPLQMAFNTTDAFFEHLAHNPALNTQFNNLMSVYHQGHASWMDPGFYPVDRLLHQFPTGNNDVLLVDVAGGKGHDLNELCTKWPNLPGRLILQDQPAVLAEATGLHSSIECMAHDFFTEQPVKGARAYFLHSILHDWPDEPCHRILDQLKSAMIPGISRLLINEYVVAKQGAHWQTTSLDMTLMAAFAGMERTESQWRRLLGKAGYCILNIWTVDRWSESLIECEVAVTGEIVRHRL